MSILKKPAPGSSDDFIRSASTWSAVIDVVNAYKSGAFEIPGARKGLVHRLRGVSHQSLSVGDVVCVDDAKSFSQFSVKNPSVHLKDPEWHTSLASLLLVDSPGLGREATVDILQSQWSVCELASSVSESDRDKKRYAMLNPDPSNPNKLKAAASGIYRILTYSPDGSKALIDTTVSQNLWRYKLEDEFKDKKAKAQLLDINGDPFTSYGQSIDLRDELGFMDDQEKDDEGVCINTGNDFHAIQAVCKDEDEDEDSSSSSS